MMPTARRRSTSAGVGNGAVELIVETSTWADRGARKDLLESLSEPRRRADEPDTHRASGMACNAPEAPERFGTPGKLELAFASHGWEVIRIKEHAGGTHIARHPPCSIHRGQAYNQGYVVSWRGERSGHSFSVPLFGGEFVVKLACQRVRILAQRITFRRAPVAC